MFASTAHTQNTIYCTSSSLERDKDKQRKQEKEEQMVFLHAGLSVCVYVCVGVCVCVRPKIPEESHQISECIIKNLSH